MYQAQLPATASTSDTSRSASRRDLPPSGTVRWVARRKAQVVTAVRNGVLTLEEACARYALSVEEFCGWQQRFDRDGLQGLRARTRHID